MTDQDQQKASAYEAANARLSANSANKVLYIVRVEDPSVKSKIRSYAALKLNETMAHYLQLIGFEYPKTETKNNTQKKINTYQEAVEIAEKENLDIEDLRFPWQRVISIKNVNYQNKSVIKR